MSQSLPHIKLIGDPAENFYQLGLKDRENYHTTLNHIKALLSTPWQGLNITLEELVKAVLLQSKKRGGALDQNLQAYAEGLARPGEDIAYALLLPEILACMSKWLPGIPAGILGCSSYFFYDEEENSPVHARVLDFPLLGSYDSGERCVTYQFKDRPTIFSYGSVGFAYPSLTAMTDSGVTFALHQKFTDVFNPSGIPIFELVFQLLSSVDSYDQALEFLKKNPSVTTWAIYMSFPDGKVLAADIAGDQVYANAHQIEPGKVIYLNNQLEDPTKQQEDYLPYGMSDYNQMRCRSASQKVGKILEKGGLTQKAFIQAISTPSSKKSTKIKNWCADSVTPSSLAIATLNPSNGTSYFLPGQAPKYYRGKVLKMSRVFEDLVQTVEKGKGKVTPEAFYQGMRHLMLAQTASDHHRDHQMYHHIQLAHDYLKDYPEGIIARFYFLIFQYNHEKHEKVLAGVLKNLKELEGTLPSYLNDLCLLYISRLEKIFSKDNSSTGQLIKNAAISKYFELEQKIPRLILHKTTANTSYPRIDLLDVLFIHLKI
ncbi:MAG: hypothetical protein HN509_08050 [Halobacteriovoraceae bacterium]|nr:hypothetical protein [Halobacteriovoraceae bacterium]